MCEFENGIKFCRCDNQSIKFRKERRYKKIKGEFVEIVTPKDAKIPLEFIWTLYRFHGEIEVTEIGRYMMPSNNLGNGLDSDWVVLNLNCEDCFDFDYEPNEGDSLKIHQNVILSPYLSFVYKNNEWVADHHDPWSTEISEIDKGKIKPI